MANKNIILFGAGASHGTTNIKPKNPPLGSGLYNELIKKFSSWQNLPRAIASKFQNNNFEQGMEYVWLNHSNMVEDLMQDMACYFAEYEIDGSNQDYYSQIVDFLIKSNKIEDYIFSTINYECLIEFALASKGRKLDYQNIQNGYSTILKLHGSCHFVVAGITVRKGLVRYTSWAQFNGSNIDIKNPKDIKVYCQNNALYPCMSLYAPGKPNQMARSYIESIQKVWQIQIMVTSKIIIIGASPNPQDSHIWNYLAKSSAHLYYIGNKADFISWANSNRPAGSYTFIDSTISGGYNQLIHIL